MASQILIYHVCQIQASSPTSAVQFIGMLYSCPQSNQAPSHIITHTITLLRHSTRPQGILKHSNILDILAILIYNIKTPMLAILTTNKKYAPIVETGEEKNYIGENRRECSEIK